MRRISRKRLAGTSDIIERKALLQITKALILGMRNSLTDPFACMKQHIVEELAAVLRMERCVIFTIRRQEVDGTFKEFCEIAAGVPLDEYGPDVRGRSPLDGHPDIKDAIQNGKVTLVTHPANDERTVYFKGIIEAKDITEIAYIPVSVDGDTPASVIVFDAVHGRSFTGDELEFCSEAAELLGLLLGQERTVLQQFRDAIVNRVVPLGGFAKRLRENMRTTLDYVEIIQREATEIDCMLPKTVGAGS